MNVTRRARLHLLALGSATALASLYAPAPASAQQAEICQDFGAIVQVQVIGQFGGQEVFSPTAPIGPQGRLDAGKQGTIYAKVYNGGAVIKEVVGSPGLTVGPFFISSGSSGGVSYARFDGEIQTTVAGSFTVTVRYTPSMTSTCIREAQFPVTVSEPEPLLPLVGLRGGLTDQLGRDKKGTVAGILNRKSSWLTFREGGNLGACAPLPFKAELRYETNLRKKPGLASKSISLEPKATCPTDATWSTSAKSAVADFSTTGFGPGTALPTLRIKHKSQSIRVWLKAMHGTHVVHDVRYVAVKRGGLFIGYSEASFKHARCGKTIKVPKVTRTPKLPACPK